MTYADYMTKIKDKKGSGLSVKIRYFNHPNRLASISLSGNVSITIDARAIDEDTGFNVGYVTEWDLDYSLANPIERILLPSDDWTGNKEDAYLNPGKMTMMHRPIEPWKMDNANPENVPSIIGTLTVTAYGIDDTGEDPVLTTDTTNHDVTLNFSLFMSLGGFPASGGFDDADASRINISTTFSHSYDPFVTVVDLPSFGSVIYRLPQDDAWSSETVSFSDIFDDWITAGGADYSGTCSLSLDFNY